METKDGDGIILIDKPTGISSFDVIRVLRKKIGVHKMGHAGTLDPMATGLLLVGVGEGTKKLKDLIGLPKTYEMGILLGRKTDTGDMEGKVIEEGGTTNVERRDIEKVLKSLEGEVELPVPVYSALKVKGVPMYKLARRGEDVEPKKRKMKIFSLKFLGVERCGGDPESSKRLEREGESRFVCVKAEMDCGSGTYARSVAVEVGKRLGVPATLNSLRRTKVGDFNVEDAEKL